MTSRSLRCALATALCCAGLALPSLAPATVVKPPKDPECQGTLSGDVKATFDCSVVVGTQASGEQVFVIRLPGPVDGIPSLVPGAFLLPGAAAKRTYTLDDLGMGKAAVAVENGALYTATKTSGQRGAVTLELRSVKKSESAPGVFVVHGTYRARLVPAGDRPVADGLAGEIIVDVKF